MPPRSEARNVVGYFERNRDHLRRWEPSRPEGFYTESYWRERLAADRLEFAEDRSARMFLYLKGQSEVVGTVNLSNIVRGCFHACYLGYGLGEEHQHQGLMGEALELVIEFAFGELGLHRLMANYQPENVRSGNLLGRLGFEVEGTAKEYLLINGAFRDHVLTSKRNPKFDAPTSES